MTEKERHITWEQQWLEGKISDEEASNQATDASEFLALKKSLEVASSFSVGENRTKNDAWNSIEEKISASQSPKIISISRNVWLTGIAASFILILGALFLFNSQNKTQSFSTEFGEVMSVYLPDSSMVHMNAGSEISFNEDNWSKNRLVKLSGEAFFEVKKGSNFVVNTGSGKVEVLGTSFNVRVRESDFNVACKTGKVRVSNAQNAVVLTPGLSTRTKNGSLIEPAEVSISSVDAWRNGESFIEGATFENAIKEIERIFNAKVEHDFTQADLERTGTFYISTKNLFEAAQSVALTMGFSFSVDENNVSFKSK